MAHAQLEEDPMTHQVDFVRTPAHTVAVTRFHVAHEALPTIGERMEDAFATVLTRLAAAHVVPTGPAMAVYQPTGDGFDVATGFHVAPEFVAPPGLERLDLTVAPAAHTTHVGPYAGLRAAYADVEAEAARAGRPVAWGAPIWEEYVSEPGTPEDQTRTEIYWPVVATS
jgi:effector-binding domain-containing protein